MYDAALTRERTFRLHCCYLLAAKSQAVQEVYMPPAMPISRFFTRFTMRVGLPHLGQGTSCTAWIFLVRSAVFAFSAIYMIPLHISKIKATSQGS